MSTCLRSQIETRLRDHPVLALVEAELRPAAVAIALVSESSGHRSVLLTRRAGSLRRHRGQWALPGGRTDPGESSEEAALRELEEEVGLAVSPAGVLGRLDDYETRSGYRITPVVVWCDRAERLEPDPREVAAVYRVSMQELEAAVPAGGRPRGPVPSLSLLGTRIFAPTAALLAHFVEVALRGRATRVQDFGEPFFAWR